MGMIEDSWKDGLDDVRALVNEGEYGYALRRCCQIHYGYDLDQSSSKFADRIFDVESVLLEAIESRGEPSDDAIERNIERAENVLEQ